jgi:hypothetical protein
MDGDALRATQNPLKDLYRADPRAGGITLSAQGDLGVGITCSVNTGGPEAGLHPSTRGDGRMRNWMSWYERQSATSSYSKASNEITERIGQPRLSPSPCD